MIENTVTVNLTLEQALLVLEAVVTKQKSNADVLDLLEGHADVATADIFRRDSKALDEAYAAIKEAL